jgi:AcrR family transcriptional regulator
MAKDDKKAMPARSEELVRRSAEVFRERGYDATSIQEIADRMGILKGSLYHYVNTKEDLLWMVMEPPLRELVDGAEQILGDISLDLTDRLVAVMVAHGESFEVNFPYMFVMTRENGDTLSEARRKDLDGLRRKYFKLLRDAIAGGQKAGEIRDDLAPSTAVHGIFGMLNWMFRWFKPGGRKKAAEVAREFADIAIEGLSTSKSSR